VKLAEEGANHLLPAAAAVVAAAVAAATAVAVAVAAEFVADQLYEP